ncbi:cation-transporting P-type ATPase [Botrimarina sp.]|uniref:cation-translocating P-type ATPase n=1 Tax=Botrimarina sp. TaxID=2795802 RepID=UPI0032EC6606
MPAPYSQPADDVLRSQGVEPDRGLAPDEVESRRDQHGPNELRSTERRSVWRLLLGQFKSVVILLLAGAAVIAFATARWPEGIALVAVVIANTAIGFVSEWRAVKSMEALRAKTDQRFRVRRGGEEQETTIEEIVPGDIVLIEGGQLVPADTRLLEANGLKANEAALTGESAAVDKRTEPLEEDTPLADRINMLYRGASVTSGSGVGVVVGTGMDTEIGRVSRMAEEAQSETPPIQQRLDSLGSRLAWLAIAIAVLVAAGGIAAGQEWTLMLETALALGIAAVPEGLPIVATIALARGMWIMAKRNALINRLTAVETLGATHVIFTDKTGTLTENRMALRRLVTPTADKTLRDGDPEQKADGDGSLDGGVRRMLEAGVLCNAASLGDDNQPPSGDPTEVALLKGGESHGVRRSELLDARPQVREVEFNSDVMMMATYHEADGGLLVAVKGAPRRVLEACTSIATGNGEQPLDDHQRDEWLQRVERLAGEGLRLLAVAEKRVDDQQAEPYEGLTFLGLTGLLDPPRSDAQDAIAECRKAGMRVVMVTGDQPTTARAIGEQIGVFREGDPPPVAGGDLRDLEDLDDETHSRILNASVFARVSPEQKLNLIRVYQEAGQVIAMTGDGVNDAPALKKADIGIAMGRRGEEAAKQVSDMVLKDDRFASIVAAVKQGRVIFSNIRKAVMFMLCTNVAEILIVAAASLVGAPLPLRPLQILYLNVLTDVFPALALGFGDGSAQVMQEPPRDPGESVLTKRHWLSIGGWSAVIAACVLAGFAAALQWLGFDTVRAVTVAFLTLGFTKLWFVLNLRDRGAKPWDNDIVRNPWVWGALVLCSGLLLLAAWWSPLQSVLPTESPGWQGWLLILGASVVPALLGLFVPCLPKRRAAADPAEQPTQTESGGGDPNDSDSLHERLDRIEQPSQENQRTLKALRNDYD